MLDLDTEARSVGMLRGIFDVEHGMPEPGLDDLQARAKLAHLEFVRSLRRDDERAEALNGRDLFTFAFAAGYTEGRDVAMATNVSPLPVSVEPAVDHVCSLCRARVAEEIGGFDLAHDEVEQLLGDASALDMLARHLGADLPGHRCLAETGRETCACGCAVWRQEDVRCMA